MSDPNAKMDALVRTAGQALAPKDDAYDFIAIGGGTTGLVSTGGLALLGLRTAIIERERLGGDCLVHGCVPSKALVHAGKVAHGVREAAAWGVRTGEVTVDFAVAMHRVREIRAGVAHDDSLEVTTGRGVDVIAGEARFVGPNSVKVGDATIRFKRALIGTGSRPRMPEIEGLTMHELLTNETVFELTQRPDRLLVLGGGPIGCELSQALQRLGCEVTLVQRAARLLPREDPEASELIAKTLRAEGVTVILEGDVTRLHKQVAAVQTPAGTLEVSFGRVLVATGRIPNIENLGLDVAGVEVEPGGITVNARLQTSNRRIYAAGDAVAGMPNFSHSAWAGAEYAALNAFFPVFLGAKRRIIPRATFTDPEVAHVGPSAQELRAAGIEFDTVTTPVAHNDRATVEGESEGFARVHLVRGKDTILAATIVGRGASEQIVVATHAMTHGQGLAALTKTVRPYPTRSEMLRDVAYARSIERITPTVKRVAQWWAGLRR